MRILVIEDESDIAHAVRVMLERHKFAVSVASDGTQGLDLLLEGTFDAAVVDIGVPKRDGFAICREVREAGISTPLLLLTARDAIEDRVRGLDAGADDYLIKPFAEDELAARLRALLRRQALPIRQRLVVGDLVIDSGARSISVDGHTVDVGSTEFRVLEYFAANAGIVLTRDQIVDRVWGSSFDGSFNIVEVYVSALRKRLRAAGARTRIVTVWGVGYKLIAA